MQTEDQGQGAHAKADLLAALILLALGLAVFWLSWTMPRLEYRNIHPSTIPGLVPMILSAALVVLSAMLALRSVRIPAAGGWAALGRGLGTMAALRVVAAMALAFVFILVLIGWLPFWLASMAFIFAFVLTFEVFLADSPRPLGRSALWALATAVVFGGGIYLVFTEIFLVRLP